MTPVLLAEDDAVWGALLTKMVEVAGYESQIAKNWIKVVRLLREQRFQSLIVDLSLVSSTEAGIEALRFVQQLNPPKTLVVCTYSSDLVTQQCLSLPFVRGLIPKPRILDHLSDLEEFFGHSLDHAKLQVLFRGDARRTTLREEGGTIDPGESKARSVFVVHGRNSRLKEDMFAFLRALGLHPIEWSEAVHATNTGAPYVGDILELAFQRASAVVVLLSGDDEAKLSKEFWHKSDPEYEKRLTPQARPNVIFEAGMAFGMKPKRTILVQTGNLRPFSDIGGRHILHFSGTPDERHALANRLTAAGCSVQRNGTDWLTVGKFIK